MNLPYLISLASHTPGVDRYLDSLSRSRFLTSAEFVNVGFLPVAPYWLPTVTHPIAYPGHLYRFDYVPRDLDPSRWWVFTDTADVIFQTPLPDLDGMGKQIYVAPESELHRNNGFWTGIIGQFPQAESLLDKPIYNMGTWAMKGAKALELIQYLKDHRAGFNCHGNSDQLMYNLWLSEQPADIVGIHPTLMVCLYANLDKGYCRKENGLWVNPTGHPYCITHGNGSTKELL